MSKSSRNRLEYLHTYFPKRNGIIPNIYEGYNFDKETLEYITPASRADEITNNLTKHFSSPFLLIEVCAGIGGNTLSFLQDSKIKLVISFEINPERRLMLKRNITSYDLGDKSYVSDKKEGFDTDNFDSDTRKLIEGCAMYFDPPWTNINGLLMTTKDQYYKPGELKVSNKTPEELLDFFSDSVKVMVWRLPPTFKELKPVNGWIYKYNLTEKNTIVFCINTRSLKTSDDYYNIIMEDKMTLKNNFKLDPTASKKLNIVYPEASKQLGINVSVFGKKLPSLGSEIVSGSEEWIIYFKKYISDLLELFISNPEIKDKMLNNDNLAFWIKAFTHETFDIDTLRNYESFETVGDSLLAYVFKKYLLNRYPTINAGQISQLKSDYLSKTFLSEIGTNLKLIEYVLTREIDPKKNIHIKEDLVESFIGALDFISERIKPGLGPVLAYNFIVILFSKTEIDFELVSGKSKTVIDQYLSRFGVSDKIKYEEERLPDGTININFTEKSLAVFRKYGKNLKNPIGIGKGVTKEASKWNSWNNALSNFEDLGINLKWVLEHTNPFKVLDNETRDRLYIKSKQDGYKLDIEIPTSSSTKDGMYVVLVGRKEGDKRVYQLQSAYSHSQDEAIRIIVNKYIRGDKLMS